MGGDSKDRNSLKKRGESEKNLTERKGKGDTTGGQKTLSVQGERQN